MCKVYIDESIPRETLNQEKIVQQVNFSKAINMEDSLLSSLNYSMKNSLDRINEMQLLKTITSLLLSKKQTISYRISTKI